MMQNNFFTYDTMKFTDVYNKAEDFLADYKDNGIPTLLKNDESVNTLFYLLYARYGNSTIAFTDVNQFKYNIFTTIFMYGPTWEEKLRLQKQVRDMTDEEILVGGKAIYNAAQNPSNSNPGAEELDFINSQNVTHYKKSKIEGIALKWELLKNDVTNEFLLKFKHLFRTILSPDHTLLYATYPTEGDNE